MQGNYRGYDGMSGWERLYGIPDFFGPTPAGRDIEFPRWVKYDFNVTHQVLPRIQGFLRVQNLFDNRIVEGYRNDFPEGGRIFTFGTRWTNF
jgi:hypothetical protein